MGTPSKILLGSAVVYVGTAGSAAATEVGYTRAGCEISWSLGSSEVTVNEEAMGFAALTSTAEVTVSCELAESTSANILRSIGETSGAFTKGLNKFSLKVVGTAGAKTITLSCLNGYSESTELSIKRGDALYIPLNYKALANIASSDGAVTYPTIVFA